MAKVSFIVPVYNVECYLRASLDSALVQTLTDIEVICVNDGSTDGSAGILDEYAARDARIKVVTQANAGLSAARNAGLRVVTGRYLLFLDSDDLLSPDAAAKLVAKADAEFLDVLFYLGQLLLIQVLHLNLLTLLEMLLHSGIFFCS